MAKEFAGESRRVVPIKLDKETRARIMEELKIEGDIELVPDTIYVIHVPHEALGLKRPEMREPWVIIPG